MKFHQLSILLFSLCGAVRVPAQGSFTPPAGPPGPTVKTLDQTEPRIPLVAGQSGVAINATTGTITISQPGSYYLTGPVTITTLAAIGINITSDNVTLDLNGFTVAKPASSGGFGIQFGAGKGVHICNGCIAGTTTRSGSSFTTGGWARGISGDGSGARITDCFVEGIASAAIYAPAATVDRCTVDVCAGPGIEAATVSDSIVTGAGDTAIKAGRGVINCYGECTGLAGSGIAAGTAVVQDSRGINDGGSVAPALSTGLAGFTVANSTGTSSHGIGLSAETARNCHGIATDGTGLIGKQVSECRGTSTAEDGVLTTGAANSSGSSSFSDGIAATGSVTFCQGLRTVSGAAISAANATGCTSAGGAVSAGQKFLGTP